jgi:uncharacterized membrane protein YphA (DoxX/SURF4 family)
MSFNKLKNIAFNKKVQLGLRIILGLFFILSALAKIYDPLTFGKALKAYAFLPQNWVGPLVLIIPYAEFILGMALLIKLYEKQALLLLLAMMLLFTAVSAYRYYTGDVFDCGCYAKFLKRQND